MVFDRGGQRLDIDRLVIIGRHGAHRRRAAHVHQSTEQLVIGRRRRRRRILRVERHRQHTVAALRHHPLDDAFGRRIAVAHAPVDDDLRLVLEDSREFLGLGAREGAQRRLVLFAVPDFGVVRAGFLRTSGQHQAVEDRIPDCLVQLDHARVRQEFAQITPHRPKIGAVRRAEIDEQDADLAGRDAGWPAGRLDGAGGCLGLASHAGGFAPTRQRRQGYERSHLQSRHQRQSKKNPPGITGGFSDRDCAVRLTDERVPSALAGIFRAPPIGRSSGL